MVLVNIDDQETMSETIYFDKDICEIHQRKNDVVIFFRNDSELRMTMTSEISAKNAIAEIRHAFLDGKNHVVNFTVANTGKAVYFVK